MEQQQQQQNNITNAKNILQLQPGYTAMDIRTAYVKLCKVYHPDKESGNAEKVQFI